MSVCSWDGEPCTPCTCPCCAREWDGKGFPPDEVCAEHCPCATEVSGFLPCLDHADCPGWQHAARRRDLLAAEAAFLDGAA